MAKNLSCGCCGCGFMTWKGYVDQDQDKGFGICRGCQEWHVELNNKQLDDLRVKIREALNEKNAAKWDTYDLETQRLLAAKCIEDGLVTWKFSHTEIMERNLPGMPKGARDEV